MAADRTVVLSRHQRGTFGEVRLPDGASARVLEKRVHDQALEAADRKLEIVMASIRKKAIDDAKPSSKRSVSN
jgi:hypothetical protein